MREIQVDFNHRTCQRPLWSSCEALFTSQKAVKRGVEVLPKKAGMWEQMSGYNYFEISRRDNSTKDAKVAS